MPVERPQFLTVGRTDWETYPDSLFEQASELAGFIGGGRYWGEYRIFSAYIRADNEVKAVGKLICEAVLSLSTYHDESPSGFDSLDLRLESFKKNFRNLEKLKRDYSSLDEPIRTRFDTGFKRMLHLYKPEFPISSLLSQALAQTRMLDLIDYYLQGLSNGQNT